MASSIRECYDVCATTGGFVTSVKASPAIRAVLHRAGSDNENYTIPMTPLLSDGLNHSFAFPSSLFSFPVGYYDLDIYDGQLLKRTVRFNLHTSGLSGVTRLIDTDCDNQRDFEPNTEAVVECKKDCNSICPSVNPPFHCEPDIVQLDRNDVRFVRSTPSPITVDRQTQNEAIRFQRSLEAKLRTSNAVVFYSEEETESIADYFNNILLSGGEI